MNKYRGTDKDIHTRIYKFVVNCFRDVVKKIPKNTENIPIISQVSSSLTSIGANDQEADATTSKKDFIAKYAIVKKETKETNYWLKVIDEMNLGYVDKINPLIQEGQEIEAIVSSIVQKSK